MSGDDDEDDLFGWNPHARRGDPDTSHEAVPPPHKLSAQALHVLKVYRNGFPLLDHTAYRLAGLSVAMNGARQRCTDLRHAGLIVRTGERSETPSGKAGYLCCITPAGSAFLKKKEGDDE